MNKQILLNNKDPQKNIIKHMNKKCVEHFYIKWIKTSLIEKSSKKVLI